MLKRNLKNILFFLCISFWFVTTYAQTSPVPVLEKTANRVIAALKANRKMIRADNNKVYPIVKSILIPHVDLNYMSQKVLGRRIWNAITPIQRKQFGREFARMVIQTYSAALSAYQDEKIKFYPVRKMRAGQNIVTVDSDIIQRGRTIKVTYQMRSTSTGWKIIDFSVEGVSIVNNFSLQFKGQVSSGTSQHVRSSFNQLIQTMKEHNRKS